MKKNIIFTLSALIISIILFESTNLDIRLEDHFYNFNVHKWILDRNQAVFKFFLYDGIKALFIVFIIIVIGSLAFLRHNSKVKEYKTGLIIVALSTILIPLTVGVLKAKTNTPCPRNITRYHGRYPYVTFLGAYPVTFKQTCKIKCFPAGHASGGFALMSLFFLFKRKRNRIVALTCAVGVGWSTGFYKMLIGDHFLSHTIDSMILAWLVILLITLLVKHQVNFSYKLLKTIN